MWQIYNKKKKLVRTMGITLIYIAIKDTFKKMFSDNSTEYKTVLAIKEVETVNFNQYLCSRKQKRIEEIKQIP